MAYKKQKIIQEKLEYRIIQGLVCEWENALWVLPESYRKLLKQPLFGIKDMKSMLGSWSSEKNEISISRQLVLNYSWDYVRKVLIHEIAHQLTTKILLPQNEPAHGLSFQKACSLLRADPAASADYKSLNEMLSFTKKNNEDNNLIKIKKLMALAESANQHEAESAMAKAQELITKYNIDLTSRLKKREYFSVFAGKPALRHQREKYHLANLLGKFYFVKCIWVSSYVVEKGKMGRVLEINGTKSNIQTAIYAHDYILRFINNNWLKYNKNNRFNRYRKIDYAVGIIQGFYDKLEKQKKNHTINSSRDIIKFDDPGLKQYYNFRYPHTKKTGKTTALRDEKILKDGIRAGNRLVISKGVTEKKAGTRLIDYKK